MLYVISDLHMNDTGMAQCVSDAELVGFASRVEADCKTQKVTLLLLGDILDLLRSPDWEAVWTEQKSAPWMGIGKGFSGFSRNYSEICAVGIAKKIRQRYSGFAGILKKLVASGQLTVMYVPGNHDYMVQLSEELREVFVEFFSLSHDPKKEFQTSYEDQGAKIYAVHGNSFDPVNWHRREDGYWALGDAVVLRIVNRFAQFGCTEIGCAPHTDLAHMLHDIDNLEPLSDVPLYIAWLAERWLSSEAQRKKLRSSWNRVVKEFLEIPEFGESRGYGRVAYKSLRAIFELSTSAGLSKLLAEGARLYPRQSLNYQTSAEALAKSIGKRFVIFGHTHRPTLEPLGMDKNEPTYYVNTGCWRRVVSRPRTNDGSFLGRRLNCYFRMDESSDLTRPNDYKLVQEWHAS
jgi:UDP-2,3-diacylglucosamine pyrophosphatase LpxH